MTFKATMVKETVYKRALLLLWLLLPAALYAQGIKTDTVANEQRQPQAFSIYVLARSYGDSVVVRWAPDDYVPWKFLNAYGYMVERIRRGDFSSDTLATYVHPLSRQQFMHRFAPEDSIAGAAVQLIFGHGKKPTETDAEPDSPGSIVELRDEQLTLYGFAMLIAEQRADLAEAMGLRYVDRTARAGESYDYVVRPLVPDSILEVHAGIAANVTIKPFEPQAFNPVITDSVVPQRNVILSWPADTHTLFDIERRDGEQGEWHRLNDAPYLASQSDATLSDTVFHFSDVVPELGTYDYRLRAYDAFGDRTAPSQPHRVVVPDLVPPSIPVLDHIDILRPDSLVLARIVWHKDTLEEDFVGFLPLYYHQTLTFGQWMPLIDQPLATTDTVCTVNVTGLQTGMLAIAAYDRAGNAGSSLPMTLRISDVTPPAIPEGLNAIVSPTGRITLRWHPSPDKDIMEYEIWKANALNHEFARITPKDLRDTVFVDTISVRANQKYIYYKVKAVDWSGNGSELSEAVAVPIPDFSQPAPCRADSVDVDTERIQIWWLASAEASAKTHRVLRRLKGDTAWTLIATIDADSLGPDHRFLMEDRPPYVQDRRYYYACETISRMGVSSGLSLQQSFLFRGPQILDVDLRLMATYDKRSGETRLAWETGGIPTEADCYYAIYRKAKGQPEFKFLTSVKRDTSTHTDYLQRPGVEADYYVKIIFRDGRQSKPSNTVTVKGARD